MSTGTRKGSMVDMFQEEKGPFILLRAPGACDVMQKMGLGR